MSDRFVGTYSHLDEDMPITIETGSARIAVSTADIVRAAFKANYGVHRLLSELVRQSVEYRRKDETDDTPLIRSIRERLEAGDYR